MGRASILLLLVAGCHSSTTVRDGCAGYAGQSCISVEVLAPQGSSLAVDQLEVAAVSGFVFRPVNDLFSSPNPSVKTPLPVVLPVLPPTDASGAFTLAVRALAGGAVIGNGTTTGVLVPGQHLSLSVTLSAGVGPDADPAQSTVSVDRATGIAADGADAAVCTVHLVDAGGNPLIGRAVAVSLDPSGAQVAPSGLTNANGDATALITSTTKGTYTITTIVEPTGSATMLEAKPTVSFVTPGKLVFTVQPKTVSVGTSMTVEVSIEDAQTGAVITDASTPITLSLGSNPTNATLSGDIAATPTNGVATFTNINLDAAGSAFTLGASAKSLTKATSAAFDITARAWTRMNSGLEGASVARLVYDPTDGNIAYATTSSGVYKSVDGGATWHFASFGAPDATWAIAIDPTTPSTLYASSFGAAVYKSTNGGASWTQLQLPPGSLSYGVVVDPARTSTLLVDTMNAILRSDDGGANWVVALPNATQLTVGAGPIYAETTTSSSVMKSDDHGQTWTPTGTAGGILTADPVSPGTLYLSGSPSKSVDSGQTWMPITTGLPANASVHRIAISKANPSRIYAALDSGGVFISNDGGQNWVNAGLPNVSAFAAAAHPLDPAKALICSLSSGVFSTADSGGTWAHASHGLPAPTRALLLSGNVLLTPTGSGLFQSLNGGVSWTRVPGLADGVEVNTVATDASGLLYIATKLEITSTPQIQRYNANSLQWTPLNASATGAPTTPGYIIAIDPADGTHLMVGGADGSVYATTNSGASSWSSQKLCNGSVTALQFVGPSHVPFAACAASASSDASGVFTSGDGGVTWTSTSGGGNGIPSTVQIYGFAANSAGSVFFAGGSNGALYRSTDHVAWTPAATGLPTTARITAVAIDPSNNSHAWVSSNKVYVTTNSGAAWAAANDGLPSSVGPLLVDATDPQTVYVSTIEGVYKTTSGGL
jgi:hypothetical protein